MIALGWMNAGKRHEITKAFSADEPLLCFGVWVGRRFEKLRHQPGDHLLHRHDSHLFL